MGGTNKPISDMNLDELSERARLYRETHDEVGEMCAHLHERFGLTWKQVGEMLGIHYVRATRWAKESRAAARHQTTEKSEAT